MLEPQPWDDPRGSFRRPLAPPVAAPTDAPFCIIEVNADWMPYVIGALKQLLLPETWIGNYDDRVFITTLVATWMAGLDCIEIPVVSCPFEFIDSTDDWHLVFPTDHGEWFIDVGWVGNVRLDANNASQAYIEHTVFLNELTHFEAQVTADDDGAGANDQVDLYVVQDGVVTSIAHSTLLAGSTTITWDGLETNVEAVRVATNLGEILSTTTIVSASYIGRSITGC